MIRIVKKKDKEKNRNFKVYLRLAHRAHGFSSFKKKKEEVPKVTHEEAKRLNRHD